MTQFKDIPDIGYFTTDDDDDAVTRIWLKHRGNTAGCIGLIVDTRLGATKMFLQDTEVKLITIEK